MMDRWRPRDYNGLLGADAGGTPVRNLLLPIAVLVLAGSPAAVARQSTLDMTCGQAARLVAGQGAVVLSTGPHTFDRFVVSPGYCAYGEYAYRRSAPTRDGRCYLGYVCDPHPPLYDNGLFNR
jgi:hypothetical protein